MSKAAIIRQSILFFLLSIALVLLVWEFVVAKPGFVRAQSHLAKLQEDYLEASGSALFGDAEGNGIMPQFTDVSIEAVLGKPAEVKPMGTGIELRRYQWRRGNLYQSYQMWVLYSARGKTEKTWVFTDYYDDESAIPATVARSEEPTEPVELPANGPMGVSAAGGGNGGSGGGGGGRRGGRANGPGNGSGNGSGDSTDNEPESSENAGENETPESGDGNG